MRVWMVLIFMLIGCRPSPSPSEMTAESQPSEEPVLVEELEEEMDPQQAERHDMVRRQIELRGVSDKKVLEAMRKVPRHLYMPAAVRLLAHADRPVPIGHKQTISQPYIVALMTELLDVEEGHRVLEIGTGSGYQAAVLGELKVELYTIEIVCPLAETAESVLKEQGYKNVHVRCGDGYKGWPEAAPFDRIIVTAAPPSIPQALIEQLKVGGKMVVPVGEGSQDLQVVTKNADGVQVESQIPVRFVPMVPGKE